MIICFPPTTHTSSAYQPFSDRIEVMGDRQNPRPRRLRLDSPRDQDYLLFLLEWSDEDDIFDEDIESDDQFSDISSDESDIISDIEENISSDSSDSESSDVGSADSTHSVVADDVWSWVYDALDFDTSSSGIQPECPIVDDSPKLDY